MFDLSCCFVSTRFSVWPLLLLLLLSELCPTRVHWQSKAASKQSSTNETAHGLMDLTCRGDLQYRYCAFAADVSCCKHTRRKHTPRYTHVKALSLLAATSLIRRKRTCKTRHFEEITLREEGGEEERSIVLPLSVALPVI